MPLRRSNGDSNTNAKKLRKNTTCRMWISAAAKRMKMPIDTNRHMAETMKQ